MLQIVEKSDVDEFDVTGRVKVTDPRCVETEVLSIFRKLYPNADLSLIEKGFDHFIRCYSGEHPDYHGVDTPYHDTHHVMDVCLACARMLAGYEMKHKDNPLGSEKVLLGFIIALFHDAGYLRYKDDYETRHGAEYTRIHVSRSGLFLEHFLKENGLAHLVDIAQTLVQFTGMEQEISALKFEDDSWRPLGYIIGTADLIAQMADRLYAQKCYDHLFTEFSIAGMTEKQNNDGKVEVIYADAVELIRKTPCFINDTLETRLKNYFSRSYEYAAVFFGGRNLYMEGIQKNLSKIIELGKQL